MIELVCIVPDLCQEKLRDINHPVALLRLWWLHNIFPVDISERFIDPDLIKELFQWQYIGTEEDIENQRFQAEYDQSPLIETIKKLVKQGNGHWEGSAQEIKDASKYLSWEIYDDVRKIGKQINRYEPLLHFDGIKIDTDRSSRGRKYIFNVIHDTNVIKMTAKKMPERAGFMISHPVATVAPTKLEDYKIHQDPPGISGELVEGRIVYDAFVLDNKKMAIYYVENKATE